MGRFQNNPSIGWVHPKSTHAHPLAWGNKKLFVNNINVNIMDMKKAHVNLFFYIYFDE